MPGIYNDTFCDIKLLMLIFLNNHL